MVLISSLIRSKIKTLASTAIPIVSTIPAIPGRVSVAAKYAIIEKINAILKIKPTLANSPNKPYEAIINKRTNIPAIIAAIFPDLILSAPNSGPTVLCSKT